MPFRVHFAAPWPAHMLRQQALENVLNEAPQTRNSADNAFNGTRKLVRPRLPVGERIRNFFHQEDPLTHAMTGEHQAARDSSHAEAFYFQKQIQQHTEMTVVLEDGEELHGVIDWYDKFVIKMRTGRKRVLVYKAAIKYLYKTSEANTVGNVMK